MYEYLASMCMFAVKCIYPLHQAAMIEDSVRVVVDRDPALEGTNITFSCSSGLVLTGPNRTTCMDNGLWEPDPRKVSCKGEKQV